MATPLTTPHPVSTARLQSPLLRRAALALLPIACAVFVWAMPGSARAATAPTVVEAVQLPAWVEHSGQRRPAQPGQTLGARDSAITAEGARMLLRLPDRSMVKLGEKTQFLIEEMAQSRSGKVDPGTLKSTLRLVTGIFRYATDYSSKALGVRRDLSLKINTATVGVRGTDFWSMTDEAHDAVCLFEGKVEVLSSAQGSIPLDKPGAFWLTFTGKPATPPGQATPDQLAKFIAQAELTPGAGIALEGGRWRAVAALLSSGVEAAALRERLRTAGYPADILVKRGRYEVRINDLATEQDATSVLERLQQATDLTADGARVALASS